MAKTATQVPQPFTYPLLGNVPNIDSHAPIQSMLRLARELGPVYRLEFPSQALLVVGAHALVDELCDETRFGKIVHAALRNLRDLGGDGLFTADTTSPNWEKAHRILMPAFGPAAMRRYFDGMLDVAVQLMDKWERLGPSVEHDVADNMTRLTLDTIALCGFGYRFNSYYKDEMHPFVGAMVRALAEAGARSRRLPVHSRLMVMTRRQYDRDLALMNDIVDGVIRERRASPGGGGEKDLLSLMLEGRDPVTGEGLDDENIRHQIVTFLIAGHETTSGLLSFTIYQLLKHRKVLERAVREVDEVLGRDPRAGVAFEQLGRLGYLDQVLRESLRLWPTAPVFAVAAHEDTVLANGIAVKAGEPMYVLAPLLHRDPEVWADPERFDPDRFSKENAKKIPPNAWKPFGSGQRACIGRAFATQEATLVLAMLLQRFELSEKNDYTLRVKETLTLKPEGFRVRVRRRPADASAAAPALRLLPRDPAPRAAEPVPVARAHATPLLVLFGSNSGSAEDLAQRFARDAARRGYDTRVAPLDEFAGRLPQGDGAGGVLIVTASYNGKPPDNARRFCAWLEEVPSGALRGVRYSVLGCGHHDWATTYQAVPRRIDELLANAGATRLAPRGEADAGGDFFGDAEGWSGAAWPAVDLAFGVAHAPEAESPRFQIERVRSQPDLLEEMYGARRVTVLANRELVDMSAPFARSKRYLEIALPDGLDYRAGDYLAVFAEQDDALTTRAARRFGLDPDEHVVIRPTRAEASTLPTDQPVRVRSLLSRYVDLQAPATRAALRVLAANTACPPENKAIRALGGDPDPEAYRREVLDKRVSLLDVLERFASCALPFGGFLELLPPMKPRRYSISSSPRRDPRRLSLTVSVLDAPAWSGDGRYRGICSNYLARLSPAESFAAAVAAPNTPFRVPEDPAVPIVMVCAGSGIAPFRGFLEERATLREEGAELGPALLFFGCDHPDVDFLFRSELERWERLGVVEVHPAFFRDERDGVLYVQHKLWREAGRVVELLAEGAHIYVCGDGARMAPAVRETFARIHRESTGGTEADAERWLAGAERDGRYVADVFAS